MFGFQGGESAETVAYKKAMMRSAQAKWHFLTNFDVSTIRNKSQLANMIKIRSRIDEAQATGDVDTWLEGQPQAPAEPAASATAALRT